MNKYAFSQLAEPPKEAYEAVTMDMASRLFGIRTAEHALVEMKDGELAYLTKRFDRRNGERILQEDFCQLAGRTSETHGPNYKYDASYEELAGLMRRYCPAARVENPKVFEILLFNYVFANGDAHLKNFSLFRRRRVGARFRALFKETMRDLDAPDLPPTPSSYDSTRRIPAMAPRT